MPSPRVASIEFITAADGLAAAGGSVDVQVKLEDGTYSSFVAATPEQPGLWMKGGRADFSFGTPVLFVSRLDRETVGRAVEAMAAEMGGYWLRYYNSLGDLSTVGRTLRLAEAKRKGKSRR